MSLDFSNGARPLWSQIDDDIREKIDSGEYKVGDILPPEMQLVDIYGVSRITIRQAMDNLMKDRYIERRRGKGTIVVEREKRVYTSMKSSFKELEEKGESAKKIVLSVDLVECPEEAAEFFNIISNEKVLLMKRVIKIEERIITLFNSYINPIVPITIKDDFSISFYKLLNSKGFEVTSGKEFISAAISDEEDKKIFSLEHSKAILTRKKYGYSNSLPVEITYSRYLAEGYSIDIELN